MGTQSTGWSMARAARQCLHKTLRQPHTTARGALHPHKGTNPLKQRSAACGALSDQVVPTAYSLKVLAQRSRQVQEAGGWVEYFDPDTSAFWYLEKVRFL